MKFTGHERDLGSPAGAGDDLDYMHARHCSPVTGRFLSYDMGPAILQKPQSWNRYSYVLGNPIRLIDPTGEVVNLSGLSESERENLLQSLNDFTGNTYGVNKDGDLIVVAYGDSASTSATAYMDELINSGDLYSVSASNNSSDVLFAQADKATNQVKVDFEDFGHLDYGKVDSRSFSLGSNLIHELRHASTKLSDPRGNTKTVGPIVEFVNQVRSERGLPTRGPGYAGVRAGFMGQKIGINFQNVDSKNPDKVFYVYFPAKLDR